MERPVVFPPIGSGLREELDVRPANLTTQAPRRHRRPRASSAAQQPSRGHHRPRVPQGVAAAPTQVVPAEQQSAQGPEDRGPPGLFETGFWLGVSLVDKILSSIGFYAICRGVWHLLGNAVNGFRGDFALRGEPAPQPQSQQPAQPVAPPQPAQQPAPAPPEEDSWQHLPDPRELLELLRSGSVDDHRIKIVLENLLSLDEQDNVYERVGYDLYPLGPLEDLKFWWQGREALRERNIQKGREAAYRRPGCIRSRAIEELERYIRTSNR